MLGAPLGAWTGWGKSVFESLAFRPIAPLNGAGGAGSTSWARTSTPQRIAARTSTVTREADLFIWLRPLSPFDRGRFSPLIIHGRGDPGGIPSLDHPSRLCAEGPARARRAGSLGRWTRPSRQRQRGRGAGARVGTSEEDPRDPLAADDSNELAQDAVHE